MTFTCNDANAVVPAALLHQYSVGTDCADTAFTLRLAAVTLKMHVVAL